MTITAIMQRRFRPLWLKLTAGFLAVASVSIALGFVSLRAVNSVSAANESVGQAAESATALGELRATYNFMRQQLLIRVIGAVDGESLPPEMKDAAEQLQAEYEEKIDERLAEWKSLTHKPEDAADCAAQAPGGIAPAGFFDALQKHKDFGGCYCRDWPFRERISEVFE